MTYPRFPCYIIGNLIYPTAIFVEKEQHNTQIPSPWRPGPVASQPAHPPQSTRPGYSPWALPITLPGTKKEERPAGRRCGNTESCRKVPGTAPGGETGLAQAARSRPTPMASVNLKGITKVYDGGVVAVRDFNLEIDDRQFVVLVGPSGCGKSTVLRMVAGLEEISSGQLYIGGRLMNRMEPQGRDVATVFPSCAFHPHLTVYDNMAFALKLHKLPPHEIARRIKRAADLLDITPYLYRKPAALSSGQRQRAALGRAIVQDPQVFLMDEPLSNLDAGLRAQMRAELGRLRQRTRAAFLYVTHDQSEAMALGDCVVIMKDGRIQQAGAPREVFDHPANVFVAGFIGTPQMNFFDALLVKQAGAYYIELADARIDLPPMTQARLADRGIPGQEILLGVRPEHILPQPGGADDTAGNLGGTVVDSERVGSALHLRVSVPLEGGAAQDVILRISAGDLSLHQGGIPRGSWLPLSLPGGLLHLFHRASGCNLL